jgi:hypothetical protein
MSAKKGKTKDLITKAETIITDARDTPSVHLVLNEMNMTYTQAIDRVIKELRSDEELFNAFKNNIVIFIYESIVKSKKNKGSELHFEEIKLACEAGAKNFLEVMTK